MNANIRAIAERLAEANVAAEANISEIYLFPADDEIRLIEIDETALPSDGQIAPFNFGPDAEDGVPFPTRIALILPQEIRTLNPPEGWGPWESAEIIWPKA